jgi:hypothetical protein
VALLVLDEQFANPRLIAALHDRGIDAATVADYGVRGLSVEREKSEIVHRYAHLIRQQAVGDHHTYTSSQHFRQPPSLTSLLRRSR